MHTIVDYKTYDIVNNEKLSLEDKRRIISYFFKILNQLEWVETDVYKLDFLLDPFLCSKYTHHENKIRICKKVILIFYVMRKKVQQSDQSILDSILYCFETNEGLFLESLDQEVYQYWLKKGEYFDETCTI